MRMRTNSAGGNRTANRKTWSAKTIGLAALVAIALPVAGGGALLRAQAPAAPAKAAAKAPAKAAVDLLVTGATVVTMDGERRVIENGGVAVRGDSIVAVGKAIELEGNYAPRVRIGARGKLVLPGLINAHSHAPMTLMRGIADDRTLQDWLENYIFPAEAKNVTSDFAKWGTRLAVLEMLRGGTTTYADMYYFEDTIAAETRAAGMRGILGETILDFPAPDNKNLSQALAYTEAFLKKWQGDPLIRAGVAPHSVYTASEHTLRESFALARKYKAPVLIHVSETKKEVDDLRARAGLTPPAYLETLGLLGPDVLAAHCVWFDAEDIALFVRHEAACVHNPSSNMMLASGVAPVPAMLAAGMRLGLATDGPSGSNNDLSMFEEIDLAAKLHKVAARNPTALSAKQALELATIGGARALHLEKEIGSLEAGKKADLIVVDTSAAHTVPAYDVYSQVAYTLKASDVETVVVNGRIVVQKGRPLTLNEPLILQKAREYAAQIKRSVASLR